jgi:broad specificity phosphatase PhoE
VGQKNKERMSHKADLLANKFERSIAIYSSPFSRAKQTAAILQRALGKAMCMFAFTRRVH